MKRTQIQPASMPKPVAEYAHGVLAEGGRTLYIAGQVPVDANGQLVGDGDIRAQARQVFSNIQAIVEEAGGTMGDLVKLTTFLTNMDDYKGFVEVRSEFIPAPYPAATLVAVTSLVRPEWLVEVEGVAVIG